MVEFVGRQHGEVPGPGVAALIGFVAQAKLSRFECAGASALHTLHFVFNPGGATGAHRFDQQRCADYTATCWTILRAVSYHTKEMERAFTVFYNNPKG